MKTMRLIFERTFAQLCASRLNTLISFLFLGWTGFMFVRALAQGEGDFTPLVTLWALTLLPALSVLAGFVTMRLIADERADGRLELLLLAPVSPWSLVLGKFWAASLMACCLMALSLLVPLVVVPHFSSTYLAGFSLVSFIPAFFILLLYTLCACAVGIFTSSCFARASMALCAQVLLVVLLPRVGYEILHAWSPLFRAQFSLLPVEAHIVNFSTGLATLPMFAFTLVPLVLALFCATRCVHTTCLAGRGARKAYFLSLLSRGAAFLLACLVLVLCSHVKGTCEFPVPGCEMRTSERTQQILSQMREDVRVICLVPHRSPHRRAATRLVQALEGAARAVAGTHFEIEWVDPRWERARAGEFLRLGVREKSLVFQSGRRHVTLRLEDLFPAKESYARQLLQAENLCASALQRLLLPLHRRTIYWTTGHGETLYDDYSPEWGMSDIARNLRQDGFDLQKLDLASTLTLPDDCALVLVSGARQAFAKAELRRLEGWLRTGGRLLVLATSTPNTGVSALLATLDLKILPSVVASPHTLGGSDVIVRDMSTHPVTQPLAGGTLIFDRPLALQAGATSPLTTWTPLARTDAHAWLESNPDVRPWTHDTASEQAGPFSLALALERGGELASETALKPLRLVVIGDASFVSNGALVRRAHANGDLFLNAVSWLAGLDALTPTRTSEAVLRMHLERPQWIRLVLASALFFPLGVLACFLLLRLIERLRS